MKKIILILITLVSFMACSKKTQEYTDSFLLPEELKDCKIFWMRGENVGSMKIVRCPNSSTTTSYEDGKTQKDITVAETEMSEAKLKESALNKLTEEEKKVLGLVQ
jgi:intein/homing endonuclease